MTHDPIVLKDLTRSFSVNLFTSSRTASIWTPNIRAPSISLESLSLLGLSPSEEEVIEVLFLMAPMKSSGRDEIQPLFWQQHWDHLKLHIVDFVGQCFGLGSFPKEDNYSFPCLIPKILGPISLKDFRPIRLCNSNYKLVIEIIAHRLRSFPLNWFTPLQFSFIIDRSIEANIVIIKEIAHFFNKAPKSINVRALKIDISKSFDSLEWSFIKDTLCKLRLPNNLINPIMSCITKVSISILWN